MTGSIPHEVPQVLINREQLPHLNFDVELLGDCDVIINELCHRLGADFAKLCYTPSRLTEITEKPPRPAPTQPEPTPSEDASADANVQPAVEPAHTPADATPPDETGTQTNTTETAEKATEHCPNAQSSSAEGTKMPDTKDSEDAQKDEALAAKDTARRRCWMNRVFHSPISKRLESKTSVNLIVLV